MPSKLALCAFVLCCDHELPRQALLTDHGLSIQPPTRRSSGSDPLRPPFERVTMRCWAVCSHSGSCGCGCRVPIFGHGRHPDQYQPARDPRFLPRIIVSPYRLAA